jgi:hypothetical protein
VQRHRVLIVPVCFALDLIAQQLHFDDHWNRGGDLRVAVLFYFVLAFQWGFDPFGITHGLRTSAHLNSLEYWATGLWTGIQPWKQENSYYEENKSPLTSQMP